MQTVIFHIAYLITQHECVIVPKLGAFVVSSSGKEKTSRWGILSPPEIHLGFNSEITHNDGLLANSLARGKKCSYREANLLIDQYVADVQQSMNEGKQVHIAWVGSLYLKDNKKMFQPDRILSCDAFNYGLTDFSLPCLENILQRTNAALPPKKNKEIIWIPVSRKLIAYTGSIAAAVLAMCIIPTPLNNGHFNQSRTQYASLVILPAHEFNGEKEVSAIKMPAPADSLPEASPSEVVNPVKTVEFHYYIIIASLPDEPSAKKTLTLFQSKGFENAAILSADGKHRVYTNRFEDKTEAEKFLIQFRKDHPANEAWLLKQKD